MSTLLFKKTYPRVKLEESLTEVDSDRIESAMDALSAKGFFDKLEESIAIAPLPGREESAKLFIEAAKEISSQHELDIEIWQQFGCIAVDLAFDTSSGLMGLNTVFGMADEFSFFTGIKGHDLIVAMRYYTHAVYLNGRQLVP